MADAKDLVERLRAEPKTWTYDGVADALYVTCSDDPVSSTTTVNDFVNVDLAEDGTTIVGIEVLNVRTAMFRGLVVDATTGAFLGDIVRACRASVQAS